MGAIRSNALAVGRPDDLAGAMTWAAEKFDRRWEYGRLLGPQSGRRQREGKQYRPSSRAKHFGQNLPSKKEFSPWGKHSCLPFLNGQTGMFAPRTVRHP
jgi:hypothetical protein